MDYFETILDITTGETTIREYTQAEIDALKKEQAIYAKEQAIKNSEQETKAAQKAAVLAKLGLTADEVVALLS